MAGAARARASQAGWFWYQTLKSHSTLLTSAESCVAGLAGATGAIRAEAPAARTTHRAIMAQIANDRPQSRASATNILESKKLIDLSESLEMSLRHPGARALRSNTQSVSLRDACPYNIIWPSTVREHSVSRGRPARHCCDADHTEDPCELPSQEGSRLRLQGKATPVAKHCGPLMESKDDDCTQNTRDTKDEPAPPLAPTLKIVAKTFLARRAALGEAALDCDGIECLYGDFVDENADEFEGFDPADGSGNDHGLKALHEEFLALFTRDVEGALVDSSLTLEDFVRDVEEARRDGLEARWDALEAATAVWFCEACWAALDIAQFAETMREAAQRQRRALDRKRAFRLLRRGAK